MRSRKLRKIQSAVFVIVLAFSMAACARSETGGKETEPFEEPADYESVEGTQIKMATENTEVVITLNASRAAADLVEMLPLELSLIERNGFAKGMTLPEQLYSGEDVTREYEIGDFGYWNAGPDLAIFYDDIYEQTIVEVVPLGHADKGAETLADETGMVRLELVEDAESVQK